MKHVFKRSIISIAVLVSMGGCASLIEKPEQIQKTLSHKTFEKEKSHANTPSNGINVIRGSHAGVYTDTKESSDSKDWLRSKNIYLDITKPVSATTLVKMFRDSGINITTTSSLDGYSYSGLGVRNMNAESALQMIFGSMGLDYESDSVNKYVTIKPMSSETWYINLGNRVTTFGASGSSSTGTVASTASTGSTGSSTGTSSGTSGSTASSSTGTTNISATDNFWDSLRTEIKSRLSILVPTQSAPSGQVQSTVGLPPPPPGVAASPAITTPALTASSSTSGMYTKQEVGTFSINPETGAITVQAPHWILKEMGDYLEKVQDMYNADITFKGELVVITNNSDHTEGIDISAFGLFAKNNYGAVVRNNTLGGVTVNFQEGSNIPSVNANAGIGGPLLGMMSNIDGLSIFNAFMDQVGTVKVIQKPLIATTSGVPGEFAKVTTSYYNRVSQTTAAGGTGSSSVGITNTLVPVLEGTVLKVNPKYDISTGMIRSQMSLEQMIKSGVQNQVQYISSGSSTDQINTPIPIITKISYSGESLLRDGDLIIVGGQTEETGQYNDVGLPGTRDQPLLSAFTGNKEVKKGSGTYYFAMQVSIKTNRNVNRTK